MKNYFMFTMMNTKKLKQYNESNRKAQRSMKLKNGSTMCKSKTPSPRPLLGCARGTIFHADWPKDINEE